MAALNVHHDTTIMLLPPFSPKATYNIQLYRFTQGGRAPKLLTIITITPFKGLDSDDMITWQNMGNTRAELHLETTGEVMPTILFGIGLYGRC